MQYNVYLFQFYAHVQQLYLLVCIVLVVPLYTTDGLRRIASTRNFRGRKYLHTLAIVTSVRGKNRRISFKKYAIKFLFIKLPNDNPSVGGIHNFDYEFPVFERIYRVSRRDSVRQNDSKRSRTSTVPRSTTKFSTVLYLFLYSLYCIHTKFSTAYSCIELSIQYLSTKFSTIDSILFSVASYPKSQIQQHWGHTGILYIPGYDNH